MVMATVDPGCGEAERLRRDVIVVEALGDVEDSVAGQADPLEGEVEVAGVGLVAPELPGGDDPVEPDPEAAGRGREEVVVAVRDHPEPEAASEPRQRIGRVREGGPVGDRSTE